MITQLVYISEYQGSDLEGDLQAILAICRKHNPGLGVTGMLMLVGNSFMQVLEGDDEQKLHDLYASISRDPRHTRVDMLLEHQVSRRLFADWSMAWLPMSDDEFLRISGITRCDYDSLLKLDSNIVTTMLQSFAEANLFQ
jgi:hypothetical protein